MVEVKIEKPLYGTMVYIRDKYLKQAIKENGPLTIICAGKKYMVGPYKWLEDAKKMEKEFLIPGKPMVLYGNHLSKFEKDLVI